MNDASNIPAESRVEGGLIYVKQARRALEYLEASVETGACIDNGDHIRMTGVLSCAILALQESEKILRPPAKKPA